MRFNNGHLSIQVHLYLVLCAIFSSSHYIHRLLPVRQCRQYRSSSLTAVSRSRSSLHLSSSSSTDNEVPYLVLRSWRLRKSDPKVLLKYSHYNTSPCPLGVRWNIIYIMYYYKINPKEYLMHKISISIGSIGSIKLFILQMTMDNVTTI